MNSFRGSLRFG